MPCFIFVESILQCRDWFVDACDMHEARRLWDVEMENDAPPERSRFTEGKTRIVDGGLISIEEVPSSYFTDRSPHQAIPTTNDRPST
jgi:hypothetical protein